jgi:plasmid stabilization system protein ParE
LGRAEEIADYMAEIDEEAASNWIDALFETVDKLDRFPKLGRMVPEFAQEEVRELIWNGYRILYQLRNGDVEILTVLNARQNLSDDEIS